MYNIRFLGILNNTFREKRNSDRFQKIPDNHILPLSQRLKKTRELPPSAGFPSPSGGVAPTAPIWATAAFGGGERKKKIGAPSAPLLGGACGAHLGNRRLQRR